MKDTPLISVIVRTINRPIYLQDCLRSIARQEYSNLEVIVINDGGPSQRELVENEDLPFPTELIEFDMSRGRSRAANEGLERAQGDYIGIIDDDDIFYPWHFSSLLQAIEAAPDRYVVFSDAVRATQVVAPYDDRQYSTIRLQMIYSQEFSKKFIRKQNFIPILTVMMSRKCVEEGIRFDPMLEVLEDWDLWIRLSEKYDFHHVREITCEYRHRVDGTNTLSQFHDQWEWARGYLKEKHHLGDIAIRG